MAGAAGWQGVPMLAFWALLILGGLAVFRSFRRDDRPAERAENGSSSTQRLLDERFARGVIDEEDYRRRGLHPVA